MEDNLENFPSMPPRRQNRLVAVQFMYMWEVNPSDNYEEAWINFIKSMHKPKNDYHFGQELVQGTISHLDQIDATIQSHTKNWAFERIAKVDLAILRISIYELFHCPKIPPIVTINEAIELSKLLSKEDARRFINGILDKVKNNLTRPFRSAAGG